MAMKREIKFRGKDSQGSWLYGNLVCYREPDGEELTCIVGDNRNEVDACVEFVPVDDATVGQFTGQKDKNGKDIYEGDIVDIYDRSLERHVSQDVFSEGGMFGIRNCFGRVTPISFFTLEDDADFSVEVIGNIYDNPELLNNE